MITDYRIVLEKSVIGLNKPINPKTMPKGGGDSVFSSYRHQRA